jgi:hypothetical protein
MNEELYAQIEGDEKALVDAMASIVAEYGKFGSPTSSVYIDYQSPAENADNYPIGVKCGNCVFHVPEGDGIACTLIDAQIQENGLCRLSMIPPGLVNAREAYKQLPITVKEAEKTYKVPQGVQSAARRALKWISEGKAGDGFTSVGRRRAAQLAAGGSVSRDTVARMRSYLARHAVDKNAEGFSAGEKGYPSPGRVAWDAWGGDAGRTWVNGIKLD